MKAKTHTVLPEEATTGQCSHCHEGVGSDHKPECVQRKKAVRLHVTLPITALVPEHWDAHDIEFYYNDGSSCALNVFYDIDAYFARRGEEGVPCPCGEVSVVYERDCEESDDLLQISANQQRDWFFQKLGRP